MVLRYPTEAGGLNDYVTFKAVKYATNASGSGGGGTAGGGGGGGSVILYMPNSTPPISNGQNWQNEKFEGPFGKMKRDIGAGIASGASKGLADVSGQERTTGYGLVEGGTALKDNIKNIPDAIRQGMVAGGGAIAGVSANQILAYSRGQIFNPNVELLYEGPQMRSFGINFNFIPKSASEAVNVRKIIQWFKIYSTPKDVGTLYELPYVFEVKYGGKAENFMNKFKRAALTSIGVQYNGGLDMHSTFSNGCPIRTDISLSFMEVDVITRKDHEKFPTGY